MFFKKLIKIFERFSKFNKMSLRNETQANSKTTLGIRRYGLGPNQTLGLYGLLSATGSLLSCKALQGQCLGIRCGDPMEISLILISFQISFHFLD